MRTLVLLAVVGLLAQLVDGSLGMAYGVTSTTLLLAIGTNPAAASATVHLAEIGTTLASGVSHWKFGNVDWKVVAKIGIPGSVGAFLGATVLSRLSTEVAAPVMATILLLLGLYILIRFTTFGLPTGRLGKPLRKRFLGPLGLVAGFVDATGGGGWGPVGTPAILASGRLEPRKTIGSIDTSEFLIAVSASLGFLIGLSGEGVNLSWALALLIGNTFPILLALLTWALGGSAPTRRTVMLMGLILLGLVFALDLPARLGASEQVGPEWILGVSASFLAACVFACALWITDHKLSSLRGSVRSMLTLMIVFSSMALAGSVDLIPGGMNLPANSTGWTALSALVLLYGIAFCMLFVTVPRLNMARNAPVMNMEPIATLLFGWLLLDQVLSGMQMIGGAIVLTGIVLLTYRKDA